MTALLKRTGLPLAVTPLLQAAALAQAYPAKTVRVVIPWPPGGSNDIVGRLVLQKMSESLKQQFVVDTLSCLTLMALP